ncbi:MAG: cyclic lactone autoinducer peptide [Oscillospiraceae bacterium]|nr:cyclic lactone autoinducer peptide [Oscillospiraceae bacterium]
MSKFISTYGHILSVCAMLAAECTAKICVFVFHQSEIPEAVRK